MLNISLFICFSFSFVSNRNLFEQWKIINKREIFPDDQLKWKKNVFSICLKYKDQTSIETRNELWWIFDEIRFFSCETKKNEILLFLSPWNVTDSNQLANDIDVNEHSTKVLSILSFISQKKFPMKNDQRNIHHTEIIFSQMNIR